MFKIFLNFQDIILDKIKKSTNINRARPSNFIVEEFFGFVRGGKNDSNVFIHNVPPHVVLHLGRER